MKRMPSYFTVITVICGMTLAGIGLTHCAEHDADDDEEEEALEAQQTVEHHGDHIIIVMNHATQQRLGLRVMSVDTDAIPSSAVVWADGRAWYYWRTHVTHLQRAPLIPTSTGVIRDIVVIGAQVLLSEEFRDHIEAE